MKSSSNTEYLQEEFIKNMKRLSQSVPLDSDRLLGFGHKVPQPLRSWYMTKSDGERGRWGGDVSVLIHPSRHSTILGPVSLRDSKQEREEKGCGGLLGESHRAGAVRPATQVAQNTNFAPRTRAPPGRGLPASAAAFANSVSDSYVPDFPQTLTDKADKKSI